MSKTIVDTILDFSKKNNVKIGLIPSRRQIEYTGGYVNRWNTVDFAHYVRGIDSSSVIIRDHGGPNQGESLDDGCNSMAIDCIYFDGIHIDIWKKYQNMDEAIENTTKYIKMCIEINNKVFFEVGTEEAIRKYEAEDLEFFLSKMRENLGINFRRIKYAVVQAGTSLKSTTNTGSYNKERLRCMVDVCKNHGVLSKEHNGDYISQADKISKFSTGLDCINIAPEFGVLETETILRNLSPTEVDEMFTICRNSKKWVKWVSKDFNPFDNKIETIKISGHYIRSHPYIVDIVEKKSLTPEIEKTILSKLKELYNNII